MDCKQSRRKEKTDQFLLFVGRYASQKLTTQCSPDEPEGMSLEVLLNYFKRKPSIMAECYKFYNRKQMPNESIAKYESELRRLAETCDFTASTVIALIPLLKSLRDQFVFGLNNDTWQRRLLQVLTFARAVKITRAAEGVYTFSTRGSSDVHAVKSIIKEKKLRRMKSLTEDKTSRV